MIRKHVMNDLRPYVCTFLNCSQAGKTYASRSALLGHEIKVHAGESRSLESLETFMQSLHKDCFFCGKVLNKAGVINLEERIRHVGRHMEEIAFTIVTKPYEDWEFYSDASTGSCQVIDRLRNMEPAFGVSSCTRMHGSRRSSDGEAGRNVCLNPLYKAVPQEDSLYHCPLPIQDDCIESPEKLECNYE